MQSSLEKLLRTLLLDRLGRKTALVTQHCDPPHRTTGYSYTYRIYVSRYRKVWGLTKGWFSKRVVLADVPPERKPERGYIWMLPRNEIRNEGTVACSPGTKPGARVRSPKPPFYETALLSPSQRYRTIPPPPFWGGGSKRGVLGGVSRVNPALSAIARYCDSTAAILSQIAVEWVTWKEYCLSACSHLWSTGG